MRIGDYLAHGNRSFSFEFFPPKTPRGVESLFATVADLRDLAPSFVSVTYGAGGSTRDLTIDLVGRIKREAGLEAMAHLTCVGHGRDDLAAILDRLAEAGVENIMALRGDPPRGETAFVRPADGFGYGAELIAFIRGRLGDRFSLGGACYPEGHVECPDRERDLRHLQAKVAAGADFLVTQLFFDNAQYFDFVARARAAGITLPIVPGIMPVTDVAQIERFTTMCGATIPPRLRALLAACPDETAVVEAGIAYATEQCRDLLERGAPGIHFYTLNKSRSTLAVMRDLDDLRVRESVSV
jgi:methylenetetrahydrofolate reductase (NADPH)